MTAILATMTILLTSFSTTSAFAFQRTTTTTTSSIRTSASTRTTARNSLTTASSKITPIATTHVLLQATASQDDTNVDTTTSSSIDILDEVDSIFDCVDTNGDGVITLEELKAHLVDQMGYTEEYTTYLFDSIDTDSNGSISKQEMSFAFYNFEALSMYMTFGVGGADITKRKAFKDLARNNSGEFSGESRDKLLLKDLADLIFDMIDTDKSGEISKDELKNHFETVTSKLSKVASGEEETATDTQAQDYVVTMFATLDADQDGGISRDEVRAAFEKYDLKLLARTFGLRVYQSSK